MTNLSYQQECILQHLSHAKAPVSPTVIGNNIRCIIGFSKLTSGSAWASPKLLALEARGLVDATPNRHYYITPAGEALLKNTDDRIAKEETP